MVPNGFIIHMTRSTGYEERFYRNISHPAELVCYEVRHKETDLFCCTDHDLGDFIKDRVLAYRYQLEAYINGNPLFQESLIPIEDDPVAPPIVREMIRASDCDRGRSHGDCRRRDL